MVGLRNSLRHRMRAQRDALPVSVRQALSETICHHLLGHALMHGVQRVALYACIGSEVDTRCLFYGLQAAGVQCLLPRVAQLHAPLEFVPVATWDAQPEGVFGAPQPTGRAVPTASVDVVVVPGLVFDRAMHRLGYGKGCYDRTLAPYSGKTVGLAFAMQVVEQLPHAPHDVALQALATEHGVRSRI